MNNPKVAIIIPVFNGINFTKKCLHKLNDLSRELGKQKDLVEIVLVDDGSKDGTWKWVSQNFPSVHLLKGDGNLWWSGGVNKGVDYALNNLEADYMLWWNNDVVPADDYLKNLFELIRTNSTEVIIGSKIFMLHNNLVWGMGGRFDTVNGTRFMYGERQPDNDSLQRPIEVDWFPGMGTAIPRKVFETIGLLDEKNFPQYHADSDFTLRAKSAGFKLIAFPELVLFNDNTNTGLFHNGSFSRLYQSLSSIKSIYGFRRDLKFLQTHATSFKAYIPFFKKYFFYIGGFLKWKFLNLIGIKKEAPEPASKGFSPENV